MMAMLVTLIFVLLKAGLGRGLSLSLTILCANAFFIFITRQICYEFWFSAICFVKVDRNGYLPGRTVRVTHLPQSLSTYHLQTTRAIPFDSSWIQSLEILSSKLHVHSLTFILLRSQNAGHKPLSNQCFFIPTARWSCFLWEHQDLHLTAFQLRITLQVRGWRVFGLSKGSQWQCLQHFAKGFPPVPAPLPSPHPLHTHIPQCIQDISENIFS